MKIDGELIKYLADLSRLELGAEERASLSGDLEDILSYVEKLSELDTGGVNDMPGFGGAEQIPFREDIVTNENRADELLTGAPDRCGAYFRVPKAIEE